VIKYSHYNFLSFSSYIGFPKRKKKNKAQGKRDSIARKENMAKRLFVGSLSYDVTQSQLEELFASVGTVESATLITDKFSGNSKGFGFVEMSSDEEADKAIAELNDKELGGRNIVVNEARPREERPAGGFNRGGGGGGGGFRDSGTRRR